MIYAIFPPCATDLAQPADSFVISKIKDKWTQLWEVERMRKIKKKVTGRHRALKRLLVGKAETHGQSLLLETRRYNRTRGE